MPMFVFTVTSTLRSHAPGTSPAIVVAVAAPIVALQPLLFGPNHTSRLVTFEPTKPVPVIVNSTLPDTPALGGSIDATVGALAVLFASGMHIVPSRCVPTPHVVSLPFATHMPSCRVVPVP